MQEDIIIPEGATPEQLKLAWEKFRHYGPADLNTLYRIYDTNIHAMQGHADVPVWVLCREVCSRLIQCHMNPRVPRTVPMIHSVQKHEVALA